MGNYHQPLQEIQGIFRGENLFQVQGQELQSLAHSCIVAVTSLNIYRHRIVGSGALISKNIVITAAHNICEKYSRQQYSDIKVYLPTVEGVVESFQEVQAVRYQQQYVREVNQHFKFDYALLKLRTQVQYKQFLKISLRCPQCLTKQNKQTQLKIFGYPHELNNNYKSYNSSHTRLNLCQFGLSLNNRIIGVDQQRKSISYGISTLPGQSGCPIMIGTQVIAIHLATKKQIISPNKVQSINIGRLFDFQLVRKLERWCNELNGQRKHSKLSKFIVYSSFQKYPNREQSNYFRFQVQNQDLCSHFDSKAKDYLRKLEIKSTKILNNNSKGLPDAGLNKYINLTHLHLQNNNLYQIDVSKNIHLSVLSLGRNYLSQIDLSKNTKLNHLDIYYNRLSQLNLKNNKSLISLNFYMNQVTRIDLTKNTSLINVSAERNILNRIHIFFSMEENFRNYVQLFNFHHQFSDSCQVQIHYNQHTNQQKQQIERMNCIELQNILNQKYRYRQFNRFNCNYRFLLAEEMIK